MICFDSPNDPLPRVDVASVLKSDHSNLFEALTGILDNMSVLVLFFLKSNDSEAKYEAAMFSVFQQQTC